MPETRALRPLVWGLFCFVGAQLLASKVTPDSISWSNAVEMANQALIAARTELANSQETLKKNNFLHSQNQHLHQSHAISEEEFRTSEWRVNHGRLAVEEAEAHVAEATVALEQANMHLAFELGNTEDVVAIAASNVKLWQARLAVARTKTRLKAVDRDHCKYEYDLVVALQANAADSSSNLAERTMQFKHSENSAQLAKKIEQDTDAALQRAEKTHAAAVGGSLTRSTRNESR